MKLQTNFSFSFNGLVPIFIGVGWVLSVVGFFLVFFMALGAVHFIRQSPELKNTLDQLQKTPVVQPEAANAPSAQELDGLKSRLKGLNALKVGGGLSAASILAKLEKLLPSGARLLSFQQEQSTGEVELVVEALSLEDLSKLLAALETDNDFSKVTLTKQSRSQGMNGNLIEFSIDLWEGSV